MRARRHDELKMSAGIAHRDQAQLHLSVFLVNGDDRDQHFKSLRNAVLLNRSFHSQPPAGRPSVVVRLTAALRPMKGSKVTIGQSEPKARRPPARRIEFHGQPREARSGPIIEP